MRNNINSPKKVNYKYITECVCFYLLQLAGENSQLWGFLLSTVSQSIGKTSPLRYTNNNHEADYKYTHTQ